MNPIKTLAGALLGMLSLAGISRQTQIAVTRTKLDPKQNPILNSIRFGSHFTLNGPPPASYNRRNQRKDRKNFRRRLAAGYSN